MIIKKMVSFFFFVCSIHTLFAPPKLVLTPVQRAQIRAGQQQQQYNALLMRVEGVRRENLEWLRRVNIKESLDLLSTNPVPFAVPLYPKVYQAGAFCRKYYAPAALAATVFYLGYSCTAFLTRNAFQDNYWKFLLSPVKKTAAEYAKIAAEKALVDNYNKGLDVFSSFFSYAILSIAVAGGINYNLTNKYTLNEEKDKHVNTLMSTMYKLPIFFAVGLGAGYAASSYLKYKLAQ